DELVPQVARHGLSKFLARIDGLRGTPGDRKQEYLDRHLRAVDYDLGRQTAPAEILVIGDALDDADAASALGLHCVLYTSHPTDQLKTAGVPVVESLMEALRVGGAI
ncbi:MAG: HAD hydrolase-like protein, partial [Acidimicrobiia bacterium]|nr:HAD hydrolase-like protein [Acidimicrobiia bacterium]